MQRIIVLSLIALILILPACVENKPPKAPPETGYKYVGSANSDKFHYPSCRYAKRILDDNLVYFTDAEDAVSHGYKPCKGCKPK